MLTKHKQQLRELIYEKDLVDRALEIKDQEMAKNLGYQEGLVEENKVLSSFKYRYEEQEKSILKKDQDEESLKAQFKSLASKVLGENSDIFEKRSEKNLRLLLDPLLNKIQSFETKTEQNNKDSAIRHGDLKAEIKHLMETNEKSKQTAENLANALRSESKTQGQWGELILENVLEKSGLEKGREYEVQTAMTTAENQRRFLDVVINLPEKRTLVIDSKVSLTAYDLYANAENKEEQNLHLRNHLQSIKSHVSELSKKNYQDLFKGKSPDFVLMFIPIDTAFSSAIREEPSLYMQAFDQNIVIVTPSTLLATLRTVDGLWQYDRQKKNSKEIADQAGRLYDKFVGFVEDMEKIDLRLGQAKDSYDEAIKKLSRGKGNLVSRVEKIKKLGASTTKEVSEELKNDSQ